MTTLQRAPAVETRTPIIARCDLNESAYPPLTAVVDALRAQTGRTNRYPEFLPDRLRAAIADHHRLPRDHVTVGAGATAVALAILADAASRARAAGIQDPRIATPAPTFDGFQLLAGMVGAGLDTTPLTDDGRPDLTALAAEIGPSTAAVIVCSPHNPTGAVVVEAELRRFLRSLRPGLRVILDQAYVEFCDDAPDGAGLLADFPDLVLLRTFSKAYGLASLRVGYAIGRADTLAGPRRHEMPFAVGTAAECAVPISLAAQDELRHRVRAMRAERARLTTMLAAIGCPVLPSHANFVFLPGADGIALGRLLRCVGVLGKECGEHGFRLTVADSATTDYIVAALRVTAEIA
ncbi:pyridoxal phosphate-dependent aminotransferase [Gordonia insulae]|uniref:Phenylalanine aminotransferase n=1 Tax=Gordonia insulae TaxID=2420509 RepID=A0A3G8JHG7_9ACTN|nr:aminotransferase class I/II-fold pyridoxal phosphate-dependent enzyme [Gordonia insulae]AZG44338.1 Putative phenylalanine aminotransferase [Gordonia insulae]